MLIGIDFELIHEGGNNFIGCSSGAMMPPIAISQSFLITNSVGGKNYDAIDVRWPCSMYHSVK